MAIALLIAQSAAAQQSDNNYEEFEDANQAEIDSLLNLIKPDSPDIIKAKIYNEAAGTTSFYENKVKYALLSLEFCKDDYLELIADNCNRIGGAYYLLDESEKAIPYNRRSAQVYHELGMYTEEGLRYNIIGNCFEDLNVTDSIFFYHNKALKIFSDIKDTANISYTYCMMGRIYYNLDLLETATENYEKALHYASLAHDTLEMATCHHYIGLTFSNKKSSSIFKAINYLKESAFLFESIETEVPYYVNIKNDTYSALANAYICAATITGKPEYADSCIVYINKVGDFYLTEDQYSNYVNHRYSYVDYLVFKKKNKEALAELLRLEKYLKKDASATSLNNYHYQLYEAYLRLGDYKKALEHFVKHDEYKFATLNDSTFISLKNAEVRRTRMLEELKLENAENMHAAERQRMRIVNISLIGGLVLISLLVFYIFRVLRIKHKANAELSEKNTLLAEQKVEIESQRDTIKAQSDAIQASINYACRIQRSLLTPDETISSIFPDHFLLYKPRDIVSGDFYWIGQFGDNKVCIVADCTGHGVPGGFLSVLGMSNLNYIVSQDVRPNVILNRLREAIITNLRQRENSPTALQDVDDTDTATIRNFDGMDAAAYVINERQMTLTFAGANNPMLLIRDSEVQVLKGDRMPVGIYSRIQPFASTTVDIQKGDCLYTFSDGFQDQFDNGVNDKFSARRLRDLLLEIHNRPMAEQKEILDNTYKQWRGPAENQTDDVVILGVRI